MTCTCRASDGPSLVTARVNVSGSPTRTGLLWDLTIDRFALVSTSTSSVSVLLPGSGSVVGLSTVARLARVPGSSDASVWTVMCSGGASVPASRLSLPFRVQVTCCPAPSGAAASQDQLPALDA